MFEQIIFFQADDETTQIALEIYENQGHEAAIKHLSEWHNPGEHETAHKPSAGTSDDTYRHDGYILTVNTSLGYIGLEYSSIPICEYCNEAPAQGTVSSNSAKVCEDCYDDQHG